MAEDLACGIEHTPINKLEERGQTTQSAQEQINQARRAGRIGPANPDPAAANRTQTSTTKCGNRLYRFNLERQPIIAFL